MENLTNQQYESILKYMQKANEQDFTKASQIMALKNYQLSLLFQQNTIRNNNNLQDDYQRKTMKARSRIDKFNSSSDLNQQQQQLQKEEQQNLYKNYVSYLKKQRQSNRVRLFIKKFCYQINFGLKRICNKCTKSTIPCLNEKMYGKEFSKIYRLNDNRKNTDTKLRIKSEISLNQGLLKTKKGTKICLILLSSPTINNCLLEFIKNDSYCKELNKYCQIIGMVQNSLIWKDSCEQYEELREQKSPSLIFCKKGLLKNLKVFKRYYDEPAIMKFDNKDLTEILKNFQRQIKREINVLKRYKNTNGRQQIQRKREVLNFRQNVIQRQDDTNRNLNNNHHQQLLQYPHDDLTQNNVYQQDYQQQQQQEYYYEDQQLYQMSGNRDNSNTPKPLSSLMIQQQNQAYKKIQQQAMRKRLHQQQQQKKQEEQRQKMKELQEQRKVRKMSIPQQPLQQQSQEEITKLSFRCPNGQIIKRNFLSSQNLELVYMWVQTNLQEIQFQNQKIRQFDLFAFFPPVSLQNKRDKTLKEVFQDGQERIMIRQL